MGEKWNHHSLKIKSERCRKKIVRNSCIKVLNEKREADEFSSTCENVGL